jgi:hypothetical protein
MQQRQRPGGNQGEVVLARFACPVTLPWVLTVCGSCAAVPGRHHVRKGTTTGGQTGPVSAYKIRCVWRTKLSPRCRLRIRRGGLGLWALQPLLCLLRRAASTLPTLHGQRVTHASSRHRGARLHLDFKPQLPPSGIADLGAGVADAAPASPPPSPPQPQDSGYDLLCGCVVTDAVCKRQGVLVQWVINAVDECVVVTCPR